METAENTIGATSQEGIHNGVTDQQYTASGEMIAPPSTAQADIEQRGGYEMQDCCADSCYCIGFIFTLGLISLCWEQDDMY